MVEPRLDEIIALKAFVHGWAPEFTRDSINKISGVAFRVASCKPPKSASVDEIELGFVDENARMSEGR